MNQFRFHAVKQDYCTEDAGRYTAYAISAEEQTPRGWINAFTVQDISCDPALVCRMAEQCTRFQVSPVHLPDVIQDTLP